MADQLFYPAGTELASLKARPFHIFDESFYDIIGANPTLTVIADGGTDPLFHEAVVWCVLSSIPRLYLIL